MLFANMVFMLSDLLKTHGVKQSLEECLVSKNYDRIREIVDALSEEALLDVVSKLSNDHLKTFINIFPNTVRSDEFINCLDSYVKDKILECISSDNLQKVLYTLSNDKLYLLVQNISDKNKNKVSHCILKHNSGAIHIKEKYSGYDIGDIISLNYIILPLFWTVKNAKAYIGKDLHRYADDCKILIANEKCEIIGYVPLHVLLVEKDTSVLSSITKKDFISKKITDIDATALTNIIYTKKCNFIIVLDMNEKIIGTVSSVDILVKNQTQITKSSDTIIPNLSFSENGAKYFIDIVISFVMSAILYCVIGLLFKENSSYRSYLFSLFISLSVSYTIYKILLPIKVDRYSIKLISRPLMAVFCNLLIVSAAVFAVLFIGENLMKAEYGVASIIISTVLSAIIIFALAFIDTTQRRQLLICKWKFLSPIVMTISVVFSVLICILF